MGCLARGSAPLTPAPFWRERNAKHEGENERFGEAGKTGVHRLPRHRERSRRNRQSRCRRRPHPERLRPVAEFEGAEDASDAPASRGSGAGKPPVHRADREVRQQPEPDRPPPEQRRKSFPRHDRKIARGLAGNCHSNYAESRKKGSGGESMAIVIKGASRGNAGQMAAYILAQGKNELSQVHDIRGTLATDPRGALVEMARSEEHTS